MRDYTIIPGYEDLPNLTARYRYLYDLLNQYRQIKDHRCTREEHTPDGCPTCPLRIRLHLRGAKATCCAWEAEAIPDDAILILEDLLRTETIEKENREMARRSVNLYWEPERPTEPDEPKPYYCPVCGEENPEHYYRDRIGKIVGCESCIEEISAPDWEADHDA